MRQVAGDRLRIPASRVVCTALLVGTASAIPLRPVLAKVPTPTETAPVTITTRAEPDTVTIGTPFRYTMRIEAPQEIELVVPVLAGKINEFEITDFGDVPHKGSNGRVVVERWYKMVTYESGDQLVPGPTVQYRVPGSGLERVDAPDTLVKVESLLEKQGKGATLRDIKGPQAVPRDYRPLWWIGGGLLGLASLGWFLNWLLNRRRAASAVPLRSAHEVALDALRQLQAARLIEAGRQEEYYVRLSGIVRRYIEGRFGIRAPEMTTEEFLVAAQRSAQIPRSHRAALQQCLTEADLVKFARHAPHPEEVRRSYGAARDFVESTVPAMEVGRAAA